MRAKSMGEANRKGALHRNAWGVTVSVVKQLFIDHAFDHAATMAFYFFLGMIPLLVFAGLLIGNVVQRQGAEALLAPLYRAMPRVAAQLMRGELDAIANADSASTAPLSVVGFLWLTTNGVHNLMDVFELLVGARPRSWLRQRLIATGWVIGGLAATTAMTWLLILLSGLASRVASLAFFIVMLGVGLGLFYRTAVARAPGVRRHVWKGTVVALLLWALVSWAFGAYVTKIAHYAVFYGSLATVAVTLLWLYLTSLALLIGAEVNATLEGDREG
jgi:membrane protein